MTRITRWNLVRVMLTTAYLLIGWLLFTWSLAPGSLALGLMHSLIVAVITYPIFIEDDEVARKSLVPRIELLGIYLVVLVFNMYVASFQVLWQILRGRINPGVAHFRTRLRTDIARVALTNSITLTPGTITLYLDDDHLIVHWLDARTTHSKYASRLIAGPYERLLKRIWT
ncbi:MAG: Na+/H+ antiporter subunit E [Spirochaetota bacterium]